jgi:hypothetical protein
MRPIEDLDLLFALQTAEGVDKLYELDAAPPSGGEDAYRFLVAMRPYSNSVMIAAHYRVVDATGRRRPDVLFFDANHPPPIVQRARPVTLSVAEREAAAFRSMDRSLLKIAQSLVTPEPDPFPTVLRVSLPQPPSARCSEVPVACLQSLAKGCGRRGFPVYPQSWTRRCSSPER